MSRPAAQLALRNGALYLPGAERTQAGAVAVADSRIAYCGPDSGLAAWLGPGTEVVDLRGGMLLPGLHDSHIHSVFGGLFVPECDLSGLTSAAEYLAALADYAAGHPDKPCLRGQGWMPSVFGPAGPRREQLDGVDASRPVVVTSADGHAAWVNSAALRLAGIGRETPDPPGGLIDRDPAGGEPSGVLRELCAIQLVSDRLPPPDPAERRCRGEEFLERMASLGVTAIHDAAAFPESLEACRRLDREGRLRLRVDAALLADPSQDSSQVLRLLEERRRYRGRNLKADSVKVFLDGTVEGHTAYLLEPYADRPDSRGSPLWGREALLGLVARLDAEGVRVHAHAMGDAAVRLALDAFAEARRRNGARDSRHMISHLELVDPADVPRFAELGVIANFQPSWFYQDDLSDAPLEGFLGRRRLNRRFCMGALYRAGAQVVSGSDWPVGGDQITCNPLDLLQTGTVRKPLCGRGRSYMPQERLPLAAMLDSMTRRAAFASFRERETGALEAGKKADLAVLDRDLFAGPPESIHRARVELTVFDGKIVYRRGG